MHDARLVRPVDVAAATQALQASSESRLVAGGMTLVPAMKLGLVRPQALVDLQGIASLRGIRASATEVVIGAMTTHAEVADSAEIRSRFLGLAELAGGIGDRMVRNLGTLGGSVANNDPAADYPAAVLAAGATIITDRRRIAADDFFTGMFSTALELDEVITAIAFPVPRCAAYAKFRNPASRYAIVGVFVARTGGGVRVAVTGAGPVVFRFAAMEKALAAAFTPEAADRVLLDPGGLNGDIHASAEYRAHLVTVMASRAVSAALNRQ